MDPAVVDPQNWDAYWERKSRKPNIAYDVIAAVYRKLFIRPRLTHLITGHFPSGSRLLHAGCGGGQVDRDLHGLMRITALDISAAALRQYRQNNPGVIAIKHASILALNIPSASFDGVYNLGVMEHFTAEEIVRIFAEFSRILVPGGKLLLFWPHVHSPSVYVLNGAHWILNEVFHKNVQLHPPEISLIRSRKEVEALLNRADFVLDEFQLSPLDLYVQAVIVARKRDASSARADHREAALSV
jgi:SAM-dependent methyltransferase